MMLHTVKIPVLNIRVHTCIYKYYTENIHIDIPQFIMVQLNDFSDLRWCKSDTHLVEKIFFEF